MSVRPYCIFDTCPGVDLNMESSLRVSRRDEEHLSQNMSKYSFFAAAFDQIRICCHITVWNCFNSGDDWKWFDHNRRKVEMITRRLDTPFIPLITSSLSLTFTSLAFPFSVFGIFFLSQSNHPTLSPLSLSINFSKMTNCLVDFMLLNWYNPLSAWKAGWTRVCVLASQH